MCLVAIDPASGTYVSSAMRRIQLLAGVYNCVDVLSLMLRVELRQGQRVRVMRGAVHTCVMTGIHHYMQGKQYVPSVHG